MKRIYLCLMTISVLLFSACNNYEVPVNGGEDSGSLQTTFTFESNQNASFPNQSAFNPSLKAGNESTAIPKVSWANVKQVQLFLYNTSTGRVAYSRIVHPTAALHTYTWNNVPAGTYRLALLANVQSGSDNIATSVDGGTTWSPFTEANVIARQLNSALKIDLKQSALPGGTPVWGSARSGYTAPSEIFTAYSTGTFTISAGTETEVSGLILKREIALMRTRVNPDSLEQKDKVSFSNTNNFIAIQRLPVGFGLEVSTFAGGILDATSDVNRVMIGASGNDTYKTQDPSSTNYEPTKIIVGSFKYWNDIHVLPNASASEKASEGIQNDSDAPNNRKYFIIISAWVDAGYKFTNDPVTGAERVAQVPQPVYWYGTINGVFTKNVIREVNLTLRTAGDPTIPIDPPLEGTLKIDVGAPENWNSEIESTQMDL